MDEYLRTRDKLLQCELSSRRLFLSGTAASLAFWCAVPKSYGATKDPRLLTIILRGGLDGLAVVAPTRDFDYQNLRGPLALKQDGSNPARPLDSYFDLNPALVFLHKLYHKREALFVHATSTPYRGRSHFDGQDVLESGLGGVGKARDGWLNRALSQMEVESLVKVRGFSVGSSIPLIMRGAAPVSSWFPRVINRDLAEDTIERLIDLYSVIDPRLAKALHQGMEVDRLDRQPLRNGTSSDLHRVGKPVRDMIAATGAVGQLMASPEGPRLATIDVSGWDTHANQGIVDGNLYYRLRGFDRAIQLLAEEMSHFWRQTVILVITEFGRTARPNGTDGSDHGTATVAMLIGGAVKGGRVVTDWPGLKKQNLWQSRDLYPTIDLRSVLKSILNEHLGLNQNILANEVFPGSHKVKPLNGLVG